MQKATITGLSIPVDSLPVFAKSMLTLLQCEMSRRGQTSLLSGERGHGRPRFRNLLPTHELELKLLYFDSFSLVNALPQSTTVLTSRTEEQTEFTQL